MGMPSARSTSPVDHTVDAPPDHPHVIAALAAITGELGPIEKLTTAERRKRGMGGGGDDERGIKYAYRGVDQVAAELQPLLAKHGVAIVPRVASHEVTDIEVGGKPWTSHTVLVHWSIYGPGGLDDKVEATTIGEGRDNSDKGVNKATTAAYKNLLLRMFSIGDPAEDPDNERHETSARSAPQLNHAAEAVRVFEQLRGLSTNQRVTEALKALKREHPGSDFKEPTLRDPEWRATVEAAVARALQDHQVDQDVADAVVPSDAGENDAGQFELGDALGEGLS